MSAPYWARVETFAAGVAALMTAEGVDGAHIMRRAHSSELSPEEFDRWVRVIAAAPRLLEAAKTLVDELRANGEVLARDEARALRCAIDKAEGGR